MLPSSEAGSETRGGRDSPILSGTRGAEPHRTAITCACTASGVPTFSPHDLRHRRVNLFHQGGKPWARIGEMIGHGDVVTTAQTYTHVGASEDELDYGALPS